MRVSLPAHEGIKWTSSDDVISLSPGRCSPGRRCSRIGQSPPDTKYCKVFFERTVSRLPWKNLIDVIQSPNLGLAEGGEPLLGQILRGVALADVLLQIQVLEGDPKPVQKEKNPRQARFEGK